MGLPEFNRSVLQKESQREELIKAAALQLIKDFAEFSMEITFSGDTTDFYQELFSQVVVYIRELLDTNYQRFLALLYRIDISEKDINRYKYQMHNSTEEEVLTELIIHRELKKVLIREYFRQQGNSLKE